MNRREKRLDHEATEWWVRRHRGLTVHEQRQFEAWKRDPDHEMAFAEVAQSWTAFDQVKASPTHVERLTAELADYHSPGPKRSIQGSYWILGVAASLALAALGYVTWWVPARIHGPYTQSVHTAVGGFKTLTLPEGSRVQLNTDTRLTVDFSTGQRRIVLERGEALFDVAKQPSRPFTVVAGGVDVRALGTAFNVRVKSSAVEVLVTEGKVAVGRPMETTSAVIAVGKTGIGAINSGSQQKVENHPTGSLAHSHDTIVNLVAGQKIAFPIGESSASAFAQGDERPSPVPAAMAETEVERSLAWKDKRLVFESAPLSEIVSEFNRYNQRKLSIADPALGSRRFGGKFEALDPQTFVALLRDTYRVTIKEGADEIVLVETAP